MKHLAQRGTEQWPLLDLYWTSPIEVMFGSFQICRLFAYISTKYVVTWNNFCILVCASCNFLIERNLGLLHPDLLQVTCWAMRQLSWTGIEALHWFVLKKKNLLQRSQLLPLLLFPLFFCCCCVVAVVVVVRSYIKWPLQSETEFIFHFLFLEKL